MNQASKITRRCVSKISVNLPFKDEVHILDAVNEAMRAVSVEADTIRERYTFVKPCCVDGEPDAHTAWLKVEGQEFCVTHLACDTKEEAEWYRTMLAKAIAGIILQLNQPTERK